MNKTEEIIKVAQEGGYEKERYYFDENGNWDWEPIEAMLMNPKFWQAIGKAKGKNGQIVESKNGDYSYIIDSQNLVDITTNWSWELQKGYLRGTKKGSKGKTKIFMHRLVIGIPIPAGMVIDHINGNRTDNRLCNLRVITTHQNGMNKSNTKLGKYRGVYYDKKKKYYVGQVRLNGVSYYAGYFKDKDEAAIKTEELRYKLFGEYHKSNNREWWLETGLEFHRINLSDPVTGWDDAINYLYELIK